MKKIALISATWHSELLEGARRSCEEVLQAQGLESEAFVVPGCLEIPLFAQKLAHSGKYAAAVAIGLIVDGRIYRHEFVAEAVLQGMMRVQLDTGMPIFSCVLTPHHFDESPERLNYFREHLLLKGREVGTACVKLLETVRAAGLEA